MWVPRYSDCTIPYLLNPTGIVTLSQNMPRYPQCPQIMNKKFEDTDIFPQFIFLEVAKYPNLSKLKALTLPNPNHNLNPAPDPGSERPGNPALPANQKEQFLQSSWYFALVLSPGICKVPHWLLSPCLFYCTASRQLKADDDSRFPPQELGHPPACDTEHFWPQP